MIKKFLSQDTITVGIVSAVVSEALCALLLWVGLLIAGQSVTSHLRWFAVCIVPPLLLLRHFAKRSRQLTATKSVIIVIFVSFVIFMWVLHKGHYLG
jgi:hypothetical protein